MLSLNSLLFSTYPSEHNGKADSQLEAPVSHARFRERCFKRGMLSVMNLNWSLSCVSFNCLMMSFLTLEAFLSSLVVEVSCARISSVNCWLIAVDALYSLSDVLEG